MELLRGTYEATLDVLLDGNQIHGTQDDALVARRDVVGHRMEEHIGVPEWKRLGEKQRII